MTDINESKKYTKQDDSQDGPHNVWLSSCVARNFRQVVRNCVIQRPESVRSKPRPRPKILCEAEAKAYEAKVKAEATVSNESCNIINFISDIS